jgi:DNA-binding NtrC family response regulator
MSTRSRSVIAVDDNVRLLDQIATMLDSTHRVLATSDATRAMAWLKNDLSVCAVIAAEGLRGNAVQDVLKCAQDLRPEARRILITNYSDLSSVVGKVHSGLVQRTISIPFEPKALVSIIGTAPLQVPTQQMRSDAAA